MEFWALGFLRWKNKAKARVGTLRRQKPSGMYMDCSCPGGGYLVSWEVSNPEPNVRPETGTLTLSRNLGPFLSNKDSEAPSIAKTHAV